MRVISKSDLPIKPNPDTTKKDLKVDLDSLISQASKVRDAEKVLVSIATRLAAIDKQLEGLWPRVNALEEKLNKAEQFNKDHIAMHSDTASRAGKDVDTIRSINSEVRMIGSNVSKALSEIASIEADGSEHKVRKIYHEVKHGAQGRIKGVLSTIVED